MSKTPTQTKVPTARDIASAPSGPELTSRVGQRDFTDNEYFAH